MSLLVQYVCLNCIFKYKLSNTKKLIFSLKLYFCNIFNSLKINYEKINVYFYGIVGFSFKSSAQCGAQANQVCGTCYGVEVPLKGFLSVDVADLRAIGATMLRKLYFMRF